MRNKILQGNCLDTLKTIPNNHAYTCVTSPPFWGLRDYGTATWVGGKEDCNHVEKIPFVGKTGIRDNSKELTQKEVKAKSILFKDVCGKCGAKRKDSQLGLEPTPDEYVANLVNVFREVKRVLKPDGTLWLNLGDSYSGKDKNLMGIPWRVAFALQADGWILRSDIIWHKPNPMPESCTDRPTKSHEYVFLFAKQGKYYYDADSIKETAIRKPNKSMAATKYDLDDPKMATKKGLQKSMMKDYRELGKNKRSVWTVTTKPYKEAHFATYPEELIMPCIKAGCPKGEIVLDPFYGAGTTGYTAYNLGRDYLGCELNPEYIKIAEKRLNQLRLF